jgi:pimeloyl-ACP methyl ester carboxylesterase
MSSTSEGYDPGHMADAHREQLVYTGSEDGYLLEGVQFTPTGGGREKLPIVWMHGFTGRFYEPHTVAIGRRLAARGHVFVSGNNRGHHLGANLVNARGGQNLRAGAWWEIFDECVFDFAAWIGFAVDLGFPRVVLAGHSLGALKAVYYMGTRQDERVAALISASGPVRIQQRMREAGERVALAQRMVAEHRGGELLPDDGTPMSSSAQTLAARARVNMDMYGLDRDDAPLAQIRCPVLFVLGSNEPEIGSEADLTLLRAKASTSRSVDTLFVPGANHVYQGCELTVADGIGDWLGRL